MLAGLPNFTFSIPTAVLTLVVLPVLYLVLRRVGRFGRQHVGQVTDGVLYVAGKFLTESAATRFSRSRYCRIQLGRAETRYLQVPGRSELSLKTDDVFVPLRLIEASGNIAEPERPGGVNGPGVRLRIVGDPGSGKTSLTKSIFRSNCREAIYASTGSRKALPILIELKRFVPPAQYAHSDDLLAQWALDQLEDRVTAVEGFDMKKLFHASLIGPGLAVFLDGLDEVPSSSYQRTAKAVNALSKRLALQSAHSSIVLTMRSQFHQQVRADFSEQYPQVAQIEPFSPAAMFEFLRRWPFPANQWEQVLRLYAELTDRPTVREMCRNPLVLAMYVASDQNTLDDSSVPDTRTSFYDQVVDELLVARRSRQLGSGARTTLREQREDLLGRLALDNLTDPDQPANSMAWATAVTTAREVLNVSTAEQAEAALRELSTETGIFAEERPGESLRFIHLTFCEFLAAKEAAVGREKGWEGLVGTSRTFLASGQPELVTRLSEVIPFAVALLPRSARSAAMRDVAALERQEILGRALLETQAYASDLWRAYVADEEKAILSVDPSNWDTDWLERLRLFNVVLQDAAEWSTFSGQDASINLEKLLADVVQSDTKRLRRVFTSYALNDAPAALRLADVCGVDLARDEPQLVIDACSFPPFLNTVLQRALAGGEGSTAWSTLMAEAGLQSSFVGENLRRRKPSVALTRKAEALPKRHRWRALPPPPSWMPRSEEYARPSSFECFLSIASAAVNDTKASGLLSVSHFARCKPPMLSLTPVPRVYEAGVLAAAVAIPVVFGAPFGVVLLIALLWFVLVQVQRRRVRVYSEMLGIAFPLRAISPSPLDRFSLLLDRLMFRRVVEAQRHLEQVRTGRFQRRRESAVNGGETSSIE